MSTASVTQGLALKPTLVTLAGALGRPVAEVPAGEPATRSIASKKRTSRRTRQKRAKASHPDHAKPMAVCG